MLISKTVNKIVEEVKWKKLSKPKGVAVWSCDGMICMGETHKNALRPTSPKGPMI